MCNGALYSFGTRAYFRTHPERSTPCDLGARLSLPLDCALYRKVLEAVEAACNEREPPFESIVFAGKGEPTLRLPVMLEVARALKAKGAMTLRLNTNGLCNLHHQRDIVPELQGIDGPWP